MNGQIITTAVASAAAATVTGIAVHFRDQKRYSKLLDDYCRLLDDYEDALDDFKDFLCEANGWDADDFIFEEDFEEDFDDE